MVYDGCKSADQPVMHRDGEDKHAENGCYSVRDAQAGICHGLELGAESIPDRVSRILKL